jgi:Mitochondrial inner membrane protein
MDEGEDGLPGGSSKGGSGKRRRAGRRAAEVADPGSQESAATESAEASADTRPVPAAETAVPDLPAGQASPGEEQPPLPSPSAAEQASDGKETPPDPPPVYEPSAQSGSEPPDDAAAPPTRRRWWWGAAAAVAAAVVIIAAVALPRPWREGRDTALDSRLAALEGQVAKLAAQPQSPSADPKEVAALASRLATLETQVGALANRPQPAAADPKEAAALSQRLTAAEQAVGRIDDMTKRLQAVEQGLAQFGDAGKRAEAAEEMRRQLDDIAARLSQLEAAPVRTGEVDPALAFRISVTETEVKSLFTRLNELTRRVDEVATTAREADRHADAATAAAQRPSPATADAALRRAFAASALSAMIARGEPFAAELAALKTVAGDKAAALAPLEPFATSGIPGPAALARELTALLPALRSKAAPAEGDGGLIEHLQSSARHLVRVRRIGEVPGDDTPAVLARLEARAAQSDIAGALSELAKLPPAVRAPAEPWMQKVAQRSAAIEAVRALSAEAFAALAKPAQ